MLPTNFSALGYSTASYSADNNWGLPADYTACESLTAADSTGIILDFIPDMDDLYDFQLTTARNPYVTFLFGGRITSQSYLILQLLTSYELSVTAGYLEDGGFSNVSFGTIASPSTLSVIFSVKNGITINGVTQYLNTDGLSWAGDLPLSLFGAYAPAENGLWGSRGATSYTYFKAYRNGLLMRDLIPALDQNGKTCMYCRASKTTYYTTNYARTYIAGSYTLKTP